jgi:biofilm PGA synthesis N-glycosyltransferase PgaC
VTTKRYVLLTAAYNEEQFIGQTIESLLLQTVLPARWVIVSDGSSDRTDEIVRGYCSRYPFIRLLRIESDRARGVIRKVNALNLAYANMQDLEYECVANLDADVSCDPRYFETLLKWLALEPTLGITGGLVYEERGGVFKGRLSNSVRSVAHAAQIVRKECYEQIGGYAPLEFGGEEWHAEVSARMRGWTVKALPELKVLHNRPTGGADSVMRHRFREGKMDHSVGSYPGFELLKCVRRVPERPFGIGALVRLAGFCWSHVRNEPRLVSLEFMNFLRTEQKNRLKALLFGVGRQRPNSVLS